MMIRKKEDLKNECDRLLGALLGYDSTLCDMWWKTQNKAFNYKTPQDMWDGDGASEVHDYLMHHAYAGGGS